VTTPGAWVDLSATWHWVPLPWAGASPRPHVRAPGAWAACPCAGQTHAPRGKTWRLSCMSLRWVRLEYHVVLGLAFLALGGSQARAPTWQHLALGLLALMHGRPTRHMTLGLAYQGRIARPAHDMTLELFALVLGQTRAPCGTRADFPCPRQEEPGSRLHTETPSAWATWLDLRATWR